MINVMTWNTGITEMKNESCKFKLDGVLNYIKQFLEKNNSIVFLQQIPYKTKVNNSWIIDSKYEKIINELKDKYQIICNSEFNDGYIKMMTVAISAKGCMEEISNDFYPLNAPTSREIAVKFKDICFLGIHARNGIKNKEYLLSLHGKADIILGDFNAGNYLESENRLTFNNILREHICVCNMPTKIVYKTRRKTCIDHVFIRDCYITKCNNLIVHDEIEFSDHYPITFEICLNE